MTIKEARQEIIDTVEAYLSKDETGAYEIPVERQRPILLMGPPGIGKTAIMEQAAAECGINLVSYTITHHTRQSAIGLPFISKRTYGGREYSVTEYTMSEIIASVYDQIERSGIREGILFLDEINCVSETLAPTMLQFLQYKTFGAHRVPDGFVIVTAGNPPEYNRSVRELDIVTLDRLKRIDIDVDFDAFKEYGYRVGIHGSIMSYLEIRRDNFYQVKADLDGKTFVTARGWEDLSRMISVYEKLGKPVSEKLVLQYLESPEIASDYAAYYDLYNRYSRIYRIEEILNGEALSGAGGHFPSENLRHAAFDEKLSLIGLLVDRLNRNFRCYSEDEDVAGKLYSGLKRLLSEKEADIRGFVARMEAELTQMTALKINTGEEIRIARKSLAAAGELERECAERGDQDIKTTVKKWFAAREKRRSEDAGLYGRQLTNAFEFLSETFGEGQELVIFLTELTAGYYSLRYVSECGNEAYFRYNRILLLDERKQELKREVYDLMGTIPDEPFATE